MDRSEVITILKSYESELRELGVRRLSVFGSTARATATETSDVDVAVQLAPGPRGFARLRSLETVELRLSELLNRPVDVVEEPARSPRVQRAIDRDRIRAF